MAQVFISYSRKDETFAQRLAAALSERKRDVWLDRKDIEFTADWKQRVLGGIEGATILVSILSPEYAASAVCREEADHAIKHNKRLVPLLRRPVDFNSLHPAISALNALPFGETDDFDAGVSQLLQAIDTDFEWLDQHTRLLQRAIEWDGKARDSSLSLRGNDLRAAEQWIAQAGTAQDRNPTQLQTEYILASRRASTRRLRVLLGLAIAAVVITAVLAIAAIAQRGIAVQRTKEVSQSLSRSDFLESTRRIASNETGAALAHLARALRVDPENSIAQRRLVSLLSQRNWQFPALEPIRHDDFIWSAQLSPDGKRIVTSYGAGSVQLWNLETGKPIGEPSKYPSVATATFNRDGSRIAVTCELNPGEESTRGSWQILDGLAGQPITSLIEEAGPITATAFSTDSSKFFLGGQDGGGGMVRAFDIASGENPETLLKFGDAVPVAFDAVGTRVIILSHGPGDKAAEKPTIARVWNLGTGKSVTMRILAERLAGQRDVRIGMIEMAHTAFERASQCSGHRLDDLNIDWFVAFLERDVVELGYPSGAGKAAKLMYLMRELGERPRQAIDFVLDRMAGRRWGQVNSPYRYDRFRRLLHRHGIPDPVFDA
jgi:hypothetical protein